MQGFKGTLKDLQEAWPQPGRLGNTEPAGNGLLLPVFQNGGKSGSGGIQYSPGTRRHYCTGCP